jgi:hypothetical protein
MERGGRKQLDSLAAVAAGDVAIIGLLHNRAGTDAVAGSRRAAHDAEHDVELHGRDSTQWRTGNRADCDLDRQCGECARDAASGADGLCRYDRTDGAR